MGDRHGLDPTLELVLGGRRASVSLGDLASAAGLPAARLRGVLLSLLLTSRCHAGAASPCPPAPPATANEGEPTEGESRRSERSQPFPTFPTFPNENMKGPETFPTSESRGSDARDGDTDPSLALQVIRRLGGEANAASLARLVRRHPEAFVLQALDAAVGVPADRIRVSRAAYFTGVLAKLTKNHPPPYDRTPPAAA